MDAALFSDIVNVPFITSHSKDSILLVFEGAHGALIEVSPLPDDDKGDPAIRALQERIKELGL